MTANKPGQAFQDLVATLERVLSSQPNVEIESPFRVGDKDTGALREHDVVIIRQDGHHVIRTAIECKDTGRKVGVPQLEAFSKKCEKTGIHHPVMVSSRGFTRTAHQKAPAIGVALMMLADVERFDWMGTDFIVGYHRVFQPIDIRVNCIDAAPTGSFQLVNSEGDVVPMQRLQALLEENLKEPEDMNALVGRVIPVALEFVTPGLFALDEKNGRYQVDSIAMDSSYVIEKRKHVVQSHKYESENAQYAVVSTDLAVGGRDGKLVFVRDQDGIQVVWQPRVPQ